MRVSASRRVDSWTILTVLGLALMLTALPATATDESAKAQSKDDGTTEQAKQAETAQTAKEADTEKPAGAIDGGMRAVPEEPQSGEPTPTTSIDPRCLFEGDQAPKASYNTLEDLYGRAWAALEESHRKQILEARADAAASEARQPLVWREINADD